MRAPRSLAAVVLAATAVTGVAGSAHAAKRPKSKVKPVCNLVTDPTGDTFLVRSQDSQGVYGPQEDALDITSMDVASNSSQLTAVVRVKKLAMTVATAPLGTDYRVSLTLPGEAAGENVFLNARTDPTGAPSFIAGYRTAVAVQSLTTKLADITGVFDLAKNEIRMTAPLSAFSGHGSAAPGARLSFAGLDQTSARQVVINPVTGVNTATFADVATSGATYLAGSPSCVVVGK